MSPLILLRMARLARRRPPFRVLVVVLAVLGVAGLLAGIEVLWGWPEALSTAARPGRLVRP